ncbi:putative mating type protein MAT-2 [Fusarium tricinctum]|uniref:Mating type protein MAT-2 n=1 Tax=Fusarium tricinctum TaxID=61284 RepID=A0A8K0RMY9_9HYPO|nr:putative mating type protein MAT-2 [Fusarium tricinctum]
MATLVLIPAGDGTPVTFSTMWSAEHIDSVFQCLAPKSTEEKRKFVIVPTQIYEDMDIGAKTALANLFMAEFGEPVLYARNNKDECYYLGAPRDIMKDGGMLIVVPGAPEAIYMQRPDHAPKRAKIPRPPNAYIIYRKERHQKIKKERPALTNNQISMILGRTWNMEKSEIRLLYKQKADIVKEEHRRMYPDYQYRPRRPSDRRRRNTPLSNPAATIAATATQFAVNQVAAAAVAPAGPAAQQNIV